VPNIEKLRKRLVSGPIPSNLPLNDLIALYESLGYSLDRIEGSHHIFTKPGEQDRHSPPQQAVCRRGT
jgi:HicA toxin of bacterial toxin-antitoxin,